MADDLTLTDDLDASGGETIFGVHIDRVVAFLTPVLGTVASIVAAWLVAHVNVAGIPGLDQGNVATWVSGALAALVTAGLVALAHTKWIKGRHIILAEEANAQA